MTLHFAATHSSGRIHLRKSASRAYTHAIVGASFNAQSFCGRRDLAVKALAQFPTWELVEARPISKDEFNALTKASKLAFAARFMGKRFTKTIDGARAPFVCAVGFHTVAHTTTHPLSDVQRANWSKRVEELRANPGTYNAESRAANIASMEQSLARGFWTQDIREHISVEFYDTQARAMVDMDRQHCTPGWRTAELLSLEA